MSKHLTGHRQRWFDRLITRGTGSEFAGNATDGRQVRQLDVLDPLWNVHLLDSGDGTCRSRRNTSLTATNMYQLND